MNPIKIKTLQEAKEYFSSLSSLWLMSTLNCGFDITVKDECTGQEYIFSVSIKEEVNDNGTC